MSGYVASSIEVNLFFLRIMKEHALFLEAGFLCKNEEWIQKADCFRREFEQLLWDTVRIADGRVDRNILESRELVTEFTEKAEKRTRCLSGICIDSKLTEEEGKLQSGRICQENPALYRTITGINRRALRLLDGLICFKENILREVTAGNLFTANYPLLIKHILREAKLYRSFVGELLRNGRISRRDMCMTETFWNQIMMEHALFIRGLLDPSEEALVDTADDYAKEYSALLEAARRQECQTMDILTEKSLSTTVKYREFKTAGTKGILECEIASLILPLLADHVLREANHYIRLLEMQRAE
ncbi:MAG: DUF2935 domain-containing protein [Clostridiales bacterium]|nr:DUF2935 domain-containing protein [Clostridiales bacterium]